MTTKQAKGKSKFGDSEARPREAPCILLTFEGEGRPGEAVQGDGQGLPPVAELQLRELAPGEMLEAGELPANSHATVTEAKDKPRGRKTVKE